MKYRTILVLSLLLSTIFLLSCITSRETYVEISCDDFMEHPTSIRNDFEIEVGDKVYVELCSNPTTGFEWSYEMSGDTAVREEDHDYSAPDNDVPGTPGKETWTFEGISKGTTEIFMAYSQPWDGGIKEEWTYKISVVVK
jgi:predicted secreted protein